LQKIYFENKHYFIHSLINFQKLIKN